MFFCSCFLFVSLFFVGFFFCPAPAIARRNAAPLSGSRRVAASLRWAPLRCTCRQGPRRRTSLRRRPDLERCHLLAPRGPQDRALSHPFFLGKETTGKSWHPYSNLSTGGPRNPSRQLQFLGRTTCEFHGKCPRDPDRGHELGCIKSQGRGGESCLVREFSWKSTIPFETLGRFISLCGEGAEPDRSDPDRRSRELFG